MLRLNMVKTIIHSYIGTKVPSGLDRSTILLRSADSGGGGGGGDKKGNEKITHHKPGGYKIYKSLTFFLCIPMIAVIAVNTFVLNAEDPHAPQPEFHAYEYLCVRNRRFPWGDGTKSLFHNPHKNALKDGYESMDHGDGNGGGEGEE